MALGDDTVYESMCCHNRYHVLLLIDLGAYEITFMNISKLIENSRYY
jgi:hypothetical protein